MKAKKQKLEEQVINLYLAKQISESLKTSMLEVLALRNKEATLGIEMFLNDQSCFDKINRHLTLFVEKNKKVGNQVLELHSKEHTLQLFNSLAKKGFLKKLDERGNFYLADDYLSKDPNDLSDQEFLLLLDVQEYALNKENKNA